jgi:hypothetical protein
MHPYPIGSKVTGVDCAGRKFGGIVIDHPGPYSVTIRAHDGAVIVASNTLIKGGKHEGT